MKILHVCLANFYIDNYAYQENILSRINRLDGHEVKIIASTETFINNANLGYVEKGTYFTEEGIEVVRLPYKKYLPHCIMRKIRHYCGTYKVVEKFSPDIIFLHGLTTLELLNFKKYKKHHEKVKIYADNHADKNNSAKGWISKNLLHKIYYKSIINSTYSILDKIFYLSLETKNFLNDIYGIGNEKMEYLPLGGCIIPDDERYKIREKVRNDLKVKPDDILIMHTGKLTRSKKTKELIEAFSKIKKGNLRLIIIGSIPEENKEYLDNLLIKDYRIQYLGWKNSYDLMNYLYACDLYAQPGGQSVTMQNALCSGSAAMLYPHESHKHLLGDSVFYVKTIDDMYNVFYNISENPGILEKKRNKSYEIAKEILDYRKIASKLYV